MSSEEEDTFRPKKRRRNEYPADLFDALSPSHQEDFIMNVTDEMGIDSEAGGDSEADDYVDTTRTPLHTSTPINSDVEGLQGPSTSRKGGRQRTNTNTKNYLTDDDSEDFVDDSDADPTYDPNPSGCNLFRRLKNMRLNRTHVSSSSDESDREAPPNIRNNNPNRDQNTTDEDPNNSNVKDASHPAFAFSKKRNEPKTFREFNFSQPMGPKIPIDISTPLTVFLLIMGPFLDQIVTESNKFAEQNQHSLNLSKDELLAFFGILIVMGFHELPSMRLYWSTKHLFRVEAIANIMSLRRFLLILRFMHLNDNSTMPKRGEPNFDRLYKLRPMINFLKKRYGDLFNPSRFLSIDESMVAFKGRSSIKQYLPNKPIKRGFKVWEIACAVTGFLINFEIYEGKNAMRAKEETLGEHVVLGLAKAFETLGYCIFFDRFFTNFFVLKKLLLKGLFGCGTIQSDRKFFPKELLKKDKDLELGDSDFAADGEISVVKWKDRGSKSVKLASNMHDPENFTEVDRRDKEGNKTKVKCPKAVADYNMYMGGVDHFDHYKSCYGIAQKSRKWWLKLFYFLLESAIVNSFILYKCVSMENRKKPMKQLLFREKLAEELIAKLPNKSPKANSSVTANKVTGKQVANLDLSNVGEHFPIQTTSRSCARCSTKEKNKRSSIACEKCNVALCLPCFKPFHNR